jgi:hypothetical protein
MNRTLQFLISILILTILNCQNNNPSNLGTNNGIYNVDRNTVALWRFDKGFGNIIYDKSGFTNEGRFEGAKWVNGLSGKALLFQSDTEYVTYLPIVSSLNISKNLTVEACIWLKDTITHLNRDIVGNLFLDNPKVGWMLSVIENDTLGFVFGNGSGSGSSWLWTKSNTALRREEWLKIAADFDGNLVRLFLNDTLIGCKEYITEIADSYGTMSIGCYSNLNRLELSEIAFLHGKIDEIRISNILRYPKW